MNQCARLALFHISFRIFFVVFFLSFVCRLIFCMRVMHSSSRLRIAWNQKCVNFFWTEMNYKLHMLDEIRFVFDSIRLTRDLINSRSRCYLCSLVMQSLPTALIARDIRVRLFRFAFFSVEFYCSFFFHLFMDFSFFTEPQFEWRRFDYLFILLSSSACQSFDLFLISFYSRLVIIVNIYKSIQSETE